MVLRRRRDFAVERKVSEKLRDRRFVQLRGMSCAMTAHIKARPVDIGLLSTNAVMPHPNRRAQFSQQLRLTRSCAISSAMMKAR